MARQCVVQQRMHMMTVLVERRHPAPAPVLHLLQVVDLFHSLADVPLVQLPQPLTAAEVDCHAVQLRELLFRSGAETADFDKRVVTLLTYDAQGPTGVALSEQLDSIGSLAATPEHWLRFSFDSPMPGLLHVFRRDALSDLVDPAAVPGAHLLGARDQGGEIVSGGKAPANPELAQGCYVEPTIVCARSYKDRIAQEEVFGPVASVIRVKNYDEALALQRALVEQRKKGEIPDTLLLLQHPHVLTLGVKGDGLEVSRVTAGGPADQAGLREKDRKALDLRVLHLERVSDFADYFLICSGSNERQVQAIRRGATFVTTQSDIALLMSAANQWTTGVRKLLDGA